MIWTILLAIPGLFLLWVVVTYVEHLLSLRHLPSGPFPLPIIGNIHLLSKKPFSDYLELAKTYGDVFSISLGMCNVFFQKKKTRNPRGFRSTEKLPMKFLVNTLFPFIRKYALLRIVVSYF